MTRPRDHRYPTPRTLAAVALVLLGTGLAASVAVTVPWPPLPHSGDVPATPAADFTRAELSRARSFYGQLRPLSYGSLGVQLVVLLALGLTPLGGRVVAAAGRPLGGHSTAQIAGGGAVISLILELADLPLRLRAETVLQEYGVSTQSWAAWWAELAKSLGLRTGLLVGALLALYGVIRALPRLWWAPAAVGAALLVVASSAVYPAVVESLFGSFRPMERSELRGELLALAEEDGVPVQRVLVVDASRRTTAMGAYVSGFGPTRRLVVYDTLLRSASPREVKLIVAHELGHTQHRDVLAGTLIGGVGAAAGICLLYLLTSWEPLVRRAGVLAMRDPRSLVLVLLLATVLSTLTTPAQRLISRQIEVRADVHALNLTRDPAGYAHVQRELAVRNVSPLRWGPVEYWLYATHPSAAQRIALSREWARSRNLPAPAPLAPHR